ncbi:MAG TPA: CHRD domain-containing protein [Gemmatimonadaceae bacterium]|nr:CHRD domain-containing protein [Gemmatimonadaceae bacterium]
MSRMLGYVLAPALLFAVACGDQASGPLDPITAPVFTHGASDSEESNGGNFGTPLSGREEVPVRPTRARGNAIFHVNAEGWSVSYKLIVANIENVVAANIHAGPRGENGPVVAWLYGPQQPGGGRIQGVIGQGTIVANHLIGPLAGQDIDALVELMKSGNAYVNVHTNDGVGAPNSGPGDFPGGEIRGQIDHRGH